MTESQGYIAILWLGVIAVAAEGWMALVLFAAALAGMLLTLAVQRMWRNRRG
jgi:hypothetical protein